MGMRAVSLYTWSRTLISRRRSTDAATDRTTQVTSTSLPASTVSSTSSPEPSAQEVRVAEVGFSEFETVDRTLTSWAVVLENRSSNMAARDVTLNLTFKGADGQVLGSLSDVVCQLRPGRTGWAYQPGVVVTPMLYGAADLQVDVSVGEWVPIGDGGGEFVVDDLELVEDPDETPKWVVTSRVSSTFEQAQDQVTAIAVLRDEAGVILGGVRAPLSAIPPGGSSEVIVEEWERLNGAATADLFITSC